MNYDTEIREIADRIRHVLNNCTDAPRLLREYAGVYTEGDVGKEVESAEDRPNNTIHELEDEVSSLKQDMTAAEDDASEAESRADRLDGELDDLKAEVEVHERALELAEADVKDLRAKLDAANEEIEDLRYQLADAFQRE